MLSLGGLGLPLFLRGDRMQHRVDVMIDPGHGGKDPGAVNPDGVLEKDLNLTAALTLKYLLGQRGIKARLTRTGDTYVPLLNRTRMAHAVGARLFISLHHDVPSATRPGVYYNDDPEAKMLAQRIAQAMGENAWVRSHHESRFGRLYIADFRGPAVLIELGATAPYGREERIRRIATVINPVMAYLKGTPYA